LAILFPGQDTVNQSEWMSIINHVTDAMLEHTRQFGTFLFQETEKAAIFQGSGSYVQRGCRVFILTCEHVAKFAPLSFSFNGALEVYKHPGPWTAQAHPIDIAFAPLGSNVWTANAHRAAAISYEDFATNHHVSEQAELLFFRGFANENANHAFGTYEAKATGYCSQEILGSGDESIFEMFWEPQQTAFIEGTPDEIRSSIKYDDPGGFSGSLVWNTRYLETVASGRNWTPLDAVVTGLLRRWDTKTKSLLVYRIEHVRTWLDQQSI
jgi:hypothetical protein